MSDRFKERLWHYLAALGTVIIGLILAVTIENPGGRYAAMCILQIGNFATAPLMVALLSQNTPVP